MIAVCALPKITRSTCMTFLSYAYRFASNFVFLVLVYVGMHAASALRSFYFFQRIERLELEARRLAAAAAEGPNSASARKQIVSEVSGLRHAGEVKSYIDLLFLALVILLCIAKIVTN